MEICSRQGMGRDGSGYVSGQVREDAAWTIENMATLPEYRGTDVTPY
jgi:hypothetical protein